LAADVPVNLVVRGVERLHKSVVVKYVDVDHTDGGVEGVGESFIEPNGVLEQEDEGADGHLMLNKPFT